MGFYITTNDGCRIHYEYEASQNKPTLVLANSLGTTMAMWQPQVEALSKHFNVLRYDMRGHGLSSVTPGDYSIDQLGHDLMSLLDHLSLEKVYFCGLSIGGMIGQWLSVNHRERVEALILANTSAYAGPASFWDERLLGIERDGLASTWSVVRKRWVSDSFAEQSPENIVFLEQMFAQMDQQGYISTCAAVRDMDLRDVAKLNTLPTLIIAGKNDVASPLEKSEYLLSQFHNATLEVLDAGHLSNIEQADLFTLAICDFVQRLNLK